MNRVAETLIKQHAGLSEFRVDLATEREATALQDALNRLGCVVSRDDYRNLLRVRMPRRAAG